MRYRDQEKDKVLGLFYYFDLLSPEAPVPDA
jgi:hypothetical protein